MLRRLIHVDEWNIGILSGVAPADLIEQPTWRVDDVEWLLAPGPFEFFADPFPEVLAEGGLRIWSETYSYLRARGDLAGHVVHPGSGLAPSDVPVRVLHRQGSIRPHVSYPSIVTDATGRRFGLMEMSQAHRLDLFHVEPDDGRWTYASTILEGEAVLDPTIVRHDDRYWLFCSMADVGPTSMLHVFHAVDLHGPWTPHPSNPVKSDVRSARPGGDVFTVDDVLYRPAQDCSGIYGEAVTINRIDALTVDHFAETTVARIEPAPSSDYPDGLHTVRVAGDVVIIDGRRKLFNAVAAPVKLAANLRQALRARRGRSMASGTRRVRGGTP